MALGLPPLGEEVGGMVGVVLSGLRRTGERDRTCSSDELEWGNSRKLVPVGSVRVINL